MIGKQNQAILPYNGRTLWECQFTLHRSRGHMTNTLSLRIGGVIICVLIGFIFPLTFLFAVMIGFSILKDMSKPDVPITSGHEGLTDVTAADESWLDKFYTFCESPAETAFLKAMISEFDLKPAEGFLSGRGLNLYMQVPVSYYRLDFLVDKRLVVEIDGAAWHSSPEAVAKDRLRDSELSDLGFETLRIPAKIALYSPNEAIARVKRSRVIVAAKDQEKGEHVRNSFRPRQIASALTQAAVAIRDGIGDMADHVHREAENIKERDKIEVDAQTEERLRLLREELDNDEELNEIYENLKRKFKW